MVRKKLLLSLALILSVGLVGCGGESLKAQFIAVPTAGSIPVNVQFTDLSEGEIDTWEWDFDGDGTVDSNLKHPHYTYTDSGKYTVSLTVRGVAGNAFETKENYLDLAPSACQADFTANTTQGKGVSEIHFIDLSYGEITSWEWDFNGDKIIDSREQNPDYKYESDGNYSVTLNVSGDSCSDTLTKRNYIEIIGCRA